MPANFHIFVLFLLLAAQVNAANFTFSYSEPRACDQLTINWHGGEPPYSLFITPRFSVPINISIPGDASGTFTTTLLLNDSSSFLLTMSDKNGFGTGGTSPLLQPASTNNNSCGTVHSPPFTFQVNQALQQCGQYVFNGYNGAAFPLEFIGIIPQGVAFPLITNAHDQFTWTVDVRAGTEIIWVAQDAKGRSGGTSDLLPVQLSSSSSCLKPNSPSSTATSTSSSRPSGKDTSAILGGAIGGGLALVLLLGGGMFLWLKKRQIHGALSVSEDGPSPDSDGQAVPLREPSSGSRSSRMRERHHVRPMPTNTDYTPSPYVPGPNEDNLEPNPFVFAGTSETTPSEAQTRRSSKAGMSTPRTPRFILHTDAEDAEEEEEVVELPPQYRPSRAPPQESGSQPIASDYSESIGTTAAGL